MPHAALACARQRAPRGPRKSVQIRWLALLFPMVAVVAQAVGLGDVTQQSELGRPLRVVIPVIATTVDELAPECFKVLPMARDAEGVPEVTNARIAVQRTGTTTQLVVTTTRPVNDPAIRITLQAGCGNLMRREYMLLLDPEPVAAPAAAQVDLPASRGDAESGAVANDQRAKRCCRTRDGRNPAHGHCRTHSSETDCAATKAPAHATAGAAPKRAASPSAPTQPKPAPLAKAAHPKAAVRQAAAVASQPKLTVSSAAPTPDPSGKGAETAPPPTSTEATNALEAETIVLRQRNRRN